MLLYLGQMHAMTAVAFELLSQRGPKTHPDFSRRGRRDWQREKNRRERPDLEIRRPTPR